MAINLVCSKCYHTRRLRVKQCSCGHIKAKFKVRVKTQDGKWLTKQVPTLELAKKVELKFQSQSILEGIGVYKAPILSEIWKKYLKHAQLNKITWKADESRWKTHLEKLGSLRMDKVTPPMIQTIIDRMNRTHKAATRRQVLQLLNRVFNWSIKNRLYHRENPCKAVTIPKVDNKVTNPLNRDEMVRLLEVLNKDDNERASLIIRYLLYSGRRKGDVLKLKWSDVDLQNGWVTYRDTKNTDHQSMPVNKHCLEILKRAEEIKVSELVFPCVTGRFYYSFPRTWYRLKKKAKVTQRLHDLRHSFASYAASSGKVNLFELQQMLGHRDIKLTQRYAHMMPDALNNAVKKTDSVFDPVSNLVPD